MPKQDKDKQPTNFRVPAIEPKMRLSKDGKWLIIQIVVIKPVAYLKKILEGSQ